MLAAIAWNLIALGLYAVGGVEIGRAHYEKHGDKIQAGLAAACWPAAPSRWLWNFLRKRFG